MREADNKRITKAINKDLVKIKKLKDWFQYDYLIRKAKIDRHTYLGLPLEETRYELELEAYEKEQELREELGREPLPEIKKRVII